MERERAGEPGIPEAVHARNAAGERLVQGAAHRQAEGGPRAVEAAQRLSVGVPAQAEPRRRGGNAGHRRPPGARAEDAGGDRIARVPGEFERDDGGGAGGKLFKEVNREVDANFTNWREFEKGFSGCKCCTTDADRKR